MIGYTNYTNLDSRYMRPYQPGDRLVRGFAGQVGPDFDRGFTDPSLLAEMVYSKHNRDDRPDGQMCPSMSIGDVVVLTINGVDTAMSVAVMGFLQVELDPKDLITNRSWKELVK